MKNGKSMKISGPDGPLKSGCTCVGIRFLKGFRQHLTVFSIEADTIENDILISHLFQRSVIMVLFYLQQGGPACFVKVFKTICGF